MSYDHKAIDERWQKIWEADKAFQASDVVSGPDAKPKYYALDMFPYPSGAGLHIGHMVSYTPTDVVSRYKRNKGFNVLHPMGYDAFGLPAEQYAIQTGVHPAVTTAKAIETFRRQLKSFGFSFDWSREISTADPRFYKWTQFIFTQLFNRGLAYQKEAPVNWCPALRTVLANDEVVDGKSERGGHPVIRKPMKQWMLKITDYAERLLADLETVNWPERTKEAQRNWIGKSVGATVFFEIVGSDSEKLEIFTTRPDTLFGATFMVIAPEHPLLLKMASPQHIPFVQDYIDASSRKSEVDRKSATEKSGVFTGAYAVNPVNGKKIPIWAADYVLMDYGTGAIMAVPGHDARDFEFASKFGLPIERVLASETDLPFEGDGQLVNSDFLNGLSKPEAIETAIAWLERASLGSRRVEYKLRDWLFSRQRYWGEPFPIVHLSNGSMKALPVNELPVVLPEVADYEPTENGEAPLARSTEWMAYNGSLGEGLRETDTMPGSAGSSWYFLRYIDPMNDGELCSFEKQKYWMPVDLYVGGPEHSVGHLLYSRFWQKVLFDVGLVSHSEPFQKLAHQGMLLASDGEKMSKSRGNVVNPDEMRDRYGADALRCYILFMGPMDRDKPWSETGIEGVNRFLERLWRACISDDVSGAGTSHVDDSVPSEDSIKLLHKTIKKVGEDIEALSFNTAISAMMILLNDLYRAGHRPRAILKPLLQILSPFAPHVCEEIWSKIGETGLIVLSPWPTYDSNLTVDNVVNIGVQVNGKSRGAIEVAKDAPEAEAVALALAVDSIAKAIAGKPVTKVIYKAGRILNLIVT
jgi:leucyl-tRNA synthetase